MASIIPELFSVELELLVISTTFCVSIVLFSPEGVKVSQLKQYE
jgi:hypothetical protein